MTTSRLASLRPAGAAGLALVAASPSPPCSTRQTTPDPTPVRRRSRLATRDTRPTPTPEPDPGADAALHERAGRRRWPRSSRPRPPGVAVVVAPFDEFALTPGDVAVAFGEIGDRFSSLALAYVERAAH